MAAGRYNTLVRIETAHREHVPAGTSESWSLVRTVQASVGYDDQFWGRENQTDGEGQVFWVIRSRDDLGSARQTGKTRYVARVNGQLTVLYPKGFPVKKGVEWMIRTVEEEDLKLPDLNYNRQGNW